MSDAIGMMEGAYFVSRSELLAWLNNNFALNYTKVEQCCSAAAHCQIIDAIYPGTVAMDKVSWDAKSEYQYINNFKVLQKAFDRNGIKRHIDVERLVKGKYQDNLEFLQWIKAFFDLKKGQLDADYDPIARRSASASAAKAPTSTQAAAPAAASAASGGAARATNARVAAKTGVAAPRSTMTSTTTTTHTTSTSVGGTGDRQRMNELQEKLQQLELQANEDQLNIENLVKERDFYFKKLRDIEILCQQIPEPKPAIVNEVVGILYAVEDGFEGPPAEE